MMACSMVARTAVLMVEKSDHQQLTDLVDSQSEFGEIISKNGVNNVLPQCQDRLIMNEK
jgi:hypothetical protein